MKSKFLLSSAVAALIFLSGCGAGTESDENTSTTTSSTTVTTISGVVADGHIKDAKVCLDLNKNNSCDADEPYATTDENGQYAFDYNGSVENGFVISQGGYDVLRDAPFTAKLSAPADKNANVTPLTSLISSYIQNTNVSVDDAKSKVASILGVEADQVMNDPTGDEVLQTTSLEVELSAEMISEIENKDITEVYSNLGKEVATSQSFDDVLNNLEISPNTLAAINVLREKIPEYVKNNNIKELASVKAVLKEKVLTAMENNQTLTADELEAQLNVATNEALTFNDYTTKAEDYYKALKLNATSATVEDAKELFKVFRDTVYEAYDENNKDNEDTIVGEMRNAFENSLNPALEAISDKLEDRLDYLNNYVFEAYGQDFDDEYKEVLDHIKDRVNAITDGISAHDTNETYEFTTIYNDTVKHTYDVDENGKVTEVYTINGKSVTATYILNNVETTLEFSGSAELKSDDYELVLDKIIEGSDYVDVEGSNGYVTGTNGNQIKIDTFQIKANIDKSKFTDSYDSYTSVSNPEVKIAGSFTISANNETFNGEITLNNSGLVLNGKATFNATTFEGNLTYNGDFSDTLEVARDSEYTLDWYDVNYIIQDGKLYTVNNKPVMYAKADNYSVTDENGTVTETFTVDLINSAGERASCSVTRKYKNTYEDSEEYDGAYKVELLSSEESCDESVSKIDIKGFKKVAITFLDKDYFVNSVILHYDGFVTYNLNGGELYYDEDEQKLYLYDDESHLLYENPNIAGIKSEDAKTIYDIPASITFSGKAVVGEIELDMDVAYQTFGDGKSSAIYAKNVKMTDYVTKNVASIESVGIDYNVEDKIDYYYQYFDDEHIIQDENDETKLSKIGLENVNATVYDNDSRPIKLENLSLVYESQEPVSVENDDEEIKNGTLTFNGKVSYLDVTLDGYSSYDFANKVLTCYLDINRTNYQPFTFGSRITIGDDVSSGYMLISRGDTILAGEINTSEDSTVLNVVSNNGVIVDVNTTDGETNVVIKDGEDKTLATFDPKTNTITYTDGTSETLY